MLSHLLFTHGYRWLQQHLVGLTSAELGDANWTLLEALDALDDLVALCFDGLLLLHHIL